MMRWLIPAFVAIWAIPADAQQCPSSALRVEVVGGSVGGCVEVTPAQDEPELNIANNCGDDQFNLAAGVDCPNCGPPLTLRPGTFGAFLVETRPLTQFEPTSAAEDHVLDWALGSSTGTLTARVVPDITICPLPDMGGDMAMVDEAEPDPIPEGNGGCSTAGVVSGWSLLFALFLASSRARRSEREQPRRRRSA